MDLLLPYIRNFSVNSSTIHLPRVAEALAEAQISFIWKQNLSFSLSKTKSKQLLKSIAVSAAVLFLFSCTNDIEDVKKVSLKNDQPLEIQEDLKLQYSDSSFIKLELTAPLAENYPQLDEPKLVFREGIVVRFFDEVGNENSRLRANYAINHSKKNLWFAEGDVVVVNKKGEQLNTEQLYWDEKKELIYTEEKVKITTADEIIWGEGFEADQNFSNYTLSKVTGQITIDDE